MKDIRFDHSTSIAVLIKAIEDEVDWFIARIQEQDLRKRELYHTIWLKKRDELREIVEEVCENFK